MQREYYSLFVLAVLFCVKIRGRNDDEKTLENMSGNSIFYRAGDELGFGFGAGIR
jgi:hypothetical protein